MYESRLASLATLETGSGHPYASLIAVAPDTDGAPVFLISKLALHTRNLEADPRATVLLAEPPGKGDPLNSGRASLMGAAEPADDPRIRSGFLARHPEAAGYAGFADFRFWRLAPERAHYVGGFGRIVTLAAAEFMPTPEEARRWVDGAEAAIGQLNDERPDLIAALAGSEAPAESGWRIAACDPCGCDLGRGTARRRVSFTSKINDPAELGEALVDAARRKAAGGA